MQPAPFQIYRRTLLPAQLPGVSSDVSSDAPSQATKPYAEAQHQFDRSPSRDGKIPPKRGKITSVACHHCQHRKSKCDGARPTCSSCQRRGLLNCTYDLPRNQKRSVYLRGQVEQCEKERANLRDIIRTIIQASSPVESECNRLMALDLVQSDFSDLDGAAQRFTKRMESTPGRSESASFRSSNRSSVSDGSISTIDEEIPDYGSVCSVGASAPAVDQTQSPYSTQAWYSSVPYTDPSNFVASDSPLYPAAPATLHDHTFWANNTMAMTPDLELLRQTQVSSCIPYNESPLYVQACGYPMASRYPTQDSMSHFGSFNYHVSFGYPSHDVKSSFHQAS